MVSICAFVSVLQFDDILNTIFSSAPLVATVVGMVLDNTLEARNTASDRGLPWWVPFRHRKGDVRNEEFYSYPIRMYDFIPSKYL